MGDYVYRYGEEAEYCYFLIKGSVAIKKPVLEEITVSSRKELLSYLLANYEKIIWEKTPNGMKLREQVI